MNGNFKVLIPNIITLLALAAGTISIFISSSGDLKLGGYFILVSYILDSLDGNLARRLNVRTEFGLHLDSLADIVSFGIAPSVLVLNYLIISDANIFLSGVLALFIPIAGASRLARFNLLPAKKGVNKESLGLTITTGGAIITLSILADLTWPEVNIPKLYYFPLIIFILILMVSKLSFPSEVWFFTGKFRKIIFISLIVIPPFFVPIFMSAFSVFFIYVIVSLGRIIWKNTQKVT